MKIKSKLSAIITISCCVLALLFVILYYTIDNIFVVQKMFATFPAMTAEEQIEKAHLIVKGTFKDKSKAFQIQPANGGDPSNFTDYYLTVEEVYRGDAAAGDVLSVRVQEGIVGTIKVEVDYEPDIQIGDTVLIYLYQTGMGGNYTTDEDYYYVLNGKKGYCILNGEGQLRNAESGEVYPLAEVKASIASIDEKTPVNKNWPYEEALEGLKGNLENGFITEEEYQQALENLNSETYGKVVKRAIWK